MDNQETSHHYSKLDKIMSAYADITADIILNKNLDEHLKEVEDDLLFLNLCIKNRKQKGKSTMALDRIALQLQDMLGILRLKQQLRQNADTYKTRSSSDTQ